MASLIGDTVLSISEPQSVEPLPCRDIYTTSQAWNANSYCTPESAASLHRCTAARRLDYFLIQPAPFQLFHAPPAAISTEPTPAAPDNPGSDVTLTSSKVMEGRQDVVTSFHFTEEQIECICAVLIQSKDIERLRCFVGRLPPEQLQRDSEQLYKVGRKSIGATYPLFSSKV